MLTSIFTIKIISRINGINFLLVIPGRLYPVKILYVYVAYQGIKKAIVQILPAWMQFRDLILCVWKYRNTLSQMKNERSCREKFKLRLLGLQLGKIASEIHFLKLYKSKELSRAQFCCCSCMWKYLDRSTTKFIQFWILLTLVYLNNLPFLAVSELPDIYN